MVVRIKTFHLTSLFLLSAIPLSTALTSPHPVTGEFDHPALTRVTSLTGPGTVSLSPGGPASHYWPADPVPTPAVTRFGRPSPLEHVRTSPAAATRATASRVDRVEPLCGLHRSRPSRPDSGVEAYGGGDGGWGGGCLMIRHR